MHYLALRLESGGPHALAERSLVSFIKGEMDIDSEEAKSRGEKKSLRFLFRFEANFRTKGKGLLFSLCAAFLGSLKKRK